MSPTTRASTGRSSRRHARRFAALGDATRLALLSRLGTGSRLSITRLAAGSKLTRQAVTKHLRVLESAGLVRSTEQGRERLFELAPEPLDDARDFLAQISCQWDEALARLKTFVEEND